MHFIPLGLGTLKREPQPAGRAIPVGVHFSGVRPSSGAAGLASGETWKRSGVFGIETLLLPRTAALPALNTYLGRQVWRIRAFSASSGRRTIPKNEAKSYGIGAALPHLAKMRNGATKKAEILFKKTLTQTAGSEKFALHTE